MCSYVEKCAEFKNQTLKKSAGTQKCYAQRNTPGECNMAYTIRWDPILNYSGSMVGGVGSTLISQ